MDAIPPTTDSPSHKHVLIGQFNALVLPRYLNSLNYRLYHHDRSADPARPEYNEHVIITLWHEFIGCVLPVWGHTPLTLLCSHHRDGELVVQTAKSLRLNIVRGSSSRGGSSAIRQMKKNSKFSSLVIAPDGPRGPRREMALGAVYMASKLQLPLVPLGVGVSNPHRLKTWDRFVIPKPLSRVRVIFGPKVHVPKKLDRDGLENVRQSMQQLTNDLSDVAEQWACSGKRMKDQTTFYRPSRRSRVVFEDLPTPSTVVATGTKCRRAA